MAERPITKHPVERGPISLVLTTFVRVVIGLILALLLSIAVEWIGMSFFWTEQGVQHSEKMLQTEVDYLNHDFKRSAFVRSPAQFAQTVAETFQETLYRKSGVERGLTWLATPTTNSGRFRTLLRKAYGAVADYILAALTITQVFAVRLAVLVLALPAFILLGLVALTDGLVERDLRRWGGGRESAFVYHWAKKVIMPSLILPWIVYLAMPVSVHPNFIVLPFTGLFALAVAVTASTFKKYL